jgi:hypothetical protein
MDETEEERELRLSRESWHRFAQKERLKQIEMFNNRIFVDIPYKDKDFYKNIFDIKWNSSLKVWCCKEEDFGDILDLIEQRGGYAKK